QRPDETARGDHGERGPARPQGQVLSRLPLDTVQDEEAGPDHARIENRADLQAPRVAPVERAPRDRIDGGQVRGRELGVAAHAGIPVAAPPLYGAGAASHPATRGGQSRPLRRPPPTKMVM